MAGGGQCGFSDSCLLARSRRQAGGSQTRANSGLSFYTIFLWECQIFYRPPPLLLMWGLDRFLLQPNLNRARGKDLYDHDVFRHGVRHNQLTYDLGLSPFATMQMTLC